MDEHPRAMDVAQKLDAQSVSLVSALDEPGDVGEDQTPHVAELGDSQIGVKRGEGIAGDLGPRGGESRQQRGLAGIRKPDEPRVRKEFQLEVDAALEPFPSLGGRPGDLVRGTGEGLVCCAEATDVRTIPNTKLCAQELME